MKIRKACREDVAAIVRLNKTLAVGPCRPGLLMWAQERSIIRSVYRGKFYIAVDKDRVIGAVQVCFHYKEIETLAVNPKLKRQGIGRALVERVIAEFKKREIKELSVGSLKIYRVRGFYCKMGFSVHERRSDCYEFRMKL